MQRYKDGRPDVKKTLLDNIEDTETYPRTPQKDDDCGAGNMASYKDGVLQTNPLIKLPKDNDAKWEDDPLSYSYNKELSSTVKEWYMFGNEFMNKLEANGDIFYTDLRRWGREMFDTAGL